jgi:uncharacterized protein YdeI (YjbR/CyaY-like superfamily)
MPESRRIPPRKAKPLSPEDGLFAAKPRKSVPYKFVLEALSPLSPATRPMFGCLAVYVGEKIMLVLRDKGGEDPDNGVWLATTHEHHESLRRAFPNMRSIGVLGKPVTGWQVLPANAPDFEEAALRACDLIAAGDPRIGKVPGARGGARPKSKKPGPDRVTETKGGLPILAFRTAADWDRWLSQQPRESKGLWLKLAKKGSGIESVSQQDAIDCALCHGWIDGQLQKYDERCWLVRFTPRSARSKWSSINQARAQELIEGGRMRPAGLKEVERARADGRWEAAYAPQSRADVPDDLRRALNRNPAAKRFFAQLDSANRYAILYRVQEAKKPETRASRIDKYVEMLSRGETIHPLKHRKQTP